MLLKFIRETRRDFRLKRQIERAANGSVTPVIIYQMGKVASSTIEASLCHLPGIQVFRAHKLNRFTQKRPEKMPLRRLESWLVFERLIKPRAPAKIVTLVREPIGRNISAYFQNLDELWNMHDAAHRLSMEELARGFFDKFDRREPLGWFDKEFKPALGIDVYQHPFSRDSGIQRIQSGPYDVLILQADLDDTIKASELARFLGVAKLDLIQKNVGEQKSYSAVYKEFTKQLVLPQSYISEMLDSQFTKHFFSDEQIAKVRKRWSRHSPPATAADGG